MGITLSPSCFLPLVEPLGAPAPSSNRFAFLCCVASLCFGFLPSCLAAQGGEVLVECGESPRHPKKKPEKKSLSTQVKSPCLWHRITSFGLLDLGGKSVAPFLTYIAALFRTPFLPSTLACPLNYSYYQHCFYILLLLSLSSRGMEMLFSKYLNPILSSPNLVSHYNRSISLTTHPGPACLIPSCFVSGSIRPRNLCPCPCPCPARMPCHMVPPP